MPRRGEKKESGGTESEQERQEGGGRVFCLYRPNITSPLSRWFLSVFLSHTYGSMENCLNKSHRCTYQTNFTFLFPESSSCPMRLMGCYCAAMTFHIMCPPVWASAQPAVFFKAFIVQCLKPPSYTNMLHLSLYYFVLNFINSVYCLSFWLAVPTMNSLFLFIFNLNSVNKFRVQ